VLLGDLGAFPIDERQLRQEVKDALGLAKERGVVEAEVDAGRGREAVRLVERRSRVLCRRVMHGSEI